MTDVADEGEPVFDSAPAVHGRIARALGQQVPPDGKAPRYIRQHLVAHAHLGGVLDDDVVPERMLPYETSGSIRGRLGLPLSEDPHRHRLAAWGLVEPVSEGLDPTSRRLSLKFHLLPMADSPLAGHGWADWSPPRNVLCRTSSPVSALEVVTVRGRPILASGEESGRIQLWDSSTGAVAGPGMLGHEGWVRCLAFMTLSNGDPILFSGGDDSVVRRWNVLTGLAVGEPLAHPDWVRSLSTAIFSNGAAVLAAGCDDGRVRLWDAATGERRLRDLIGDRGGRPVRAVQFFRTSGTVFLVTGSEAGEVRIWDPLTGAELHQLPQNPGAKVRGLVFLPERKGNGSLVVNTAGTNGMRTYDVSRIASESPKEIPSPWSWTNHGNTTGATPLVMADGRMAIATSGLDATVHLYSSPYRHDVLTGHRGWVRAITTLRAESGIDFVVSGGDDATIRIWNPNDGASNRSATRDDQTDVVTLDMIDLGAEREVLAIGVPNRGAPKTVDVRTGRPVGSPLRGLNGEVRTLALYRNEAGADRLAVGGSDGVVSFWEPNAGYPALPSVALGSGAVQALKGLSANGRQLLALGGLGRQVQLLAPDRAAVMADDLPISNVTTLSASSEGTELVCGTADGTVFIGSTTPGSSARVRLLAPTRWRELTPGQGPVAVAVTATVVARSPTGEVVLIGYGDGQVTVQDLVTGRLRHTWNAPAADSEPPQDSQRPAPRTHGVTSMLVMATASGPLVFWADRGGDVWWWDPVQGDPPRKRSISETPINALASQPVLDTEGLVTAHTGGVVKMWDLSVVMSDPVQPYPAVMKPLATLERSGAVLALAAGLRILDGRKLIAVGRDNGVVDLWDPTVQPTSRKAGVQAVRWSVSPGQSPQSVSLQDGRVQYHDLTTGEVVYERFFQSDGTVMALGSSGRLAIGDGTGFIRLSRLAVEVRNPNIQAHLLGVGAMQFTSAPGKAEVLVSGGIDGRLACWSSTGEPLVWPWSAHQGEVRALTLVNRAGQQLVASAGEDGAARVWNPWTRLAVGEPMRSRFGGLRAIVAAYRGDTAYLITGGTDNYLDFWDLETSSRRASIYVASNVWSLAVTSRPFDGVSVNSYLAVGGPAGSAVLPLDWLD